ncbi:F-box/kelch-repeat protein At3g23880-like [Trifolium pratense]|uniref:F-box/kelch-repeat protein At3g23880-like n=1 Tax=Trifolium pratense TaxID=57577 RepID=UPI001E696314|nr:F-box/kelch-repeat protein At3g23880-like [Trifolium pratense]
MMTAGSKGDAENNGASYQSPTVEKLTPISSSSTTPDNSIDAPSLPTLPFDLVTKILCWIPVKFLLQLCCVCKSWNYLISQDSKFQKKHFRLSTTLHDRLHLILTPMPYYFRKFILSDFLMSSLFNNNLSTITSRQIKYSVLSTRKLSFGGVSSCHGMFCFGIDELSALFFNPSIRKFKLLPPLENPPQNHYVQTNYTLMYHRFTNNYKIVAVSVASFAKSRQLNVHSHILGTNYWTRIQSVPFYCRVRVGISVNDDTIDWLVYDVDNCLWLILSLDLEKDSYRKLLHPLSNDKYESNMVFQELKGCLCIVSQRPSHSDVWIMKEYGNEQSWTKLFSVPNMTYLEFYAYGRILYVSEDDQVLMQFLTRKKSSLVIYDFRNDTFNIPKIQNINDDLVIPNIYVESLISPFSQY